jgi:GTPase SAR1 family protein
MDAINWNTAGFEEFQKRQEQLRRQAQATILFVSIDNYPDGQEKEALFRQNGFEANINRGLGGVSIFIESASDLTRLQDFATSHGLLLEMSIPRT